MNWKTIFSLSVFGFLMGVASILGYTQDIELYLWVGIAIICGYVISKSGGKLFWNSVLTGLFLAIFKSIIQAVFLEMYLTNNPDIAVPTQDGALEFTAGFVLLIGIPIGVAYGLFIALLSWTFSKFAKRTAEA